MNSQRLILVTGASGYVGGRLVRDLVSDNCRVRVLVRDAHKVNEQPWAKDVEIDFELSISQHNLLYQFQKFFDIVIRQR